MSNLLPWQRDHAEHVFAALREHDVCADTSSTGAGKTYVAAWVTIQLGYNPVVICPKSVIPDWLRVMTLFHPGLEVKVSNYEAVLAAAERVTKGERTQRKPGSLGHWTIFRRRWDWDGLPDNPILIFDEAHRLSGRTSQLSKMLVAASTDRIPTLMLSATLADSPLKMRAIGYALGICSYNSNEHTGWLLTHGCRQGAFGIELASAEVVARGMDRARREAAGKIFGIKTSEVEGFPESNVILREVPCEGVEGVDDAYAEALLELQESALEPIIEALRGRQLSEWGKRRAMIEMARDAVLEGNNVVIFTAFRATGEWLSETLKVGFIHGDDENRGELISEFQANKTSIIVVMVQAGGEGISLHDLHGRPRVTIICPTYNALQLVQCLGRVVRAGGQSPSNQYIVFAEGSKVERRVYLSLRRKIKNIEALTDSDLSINPDNDMPKKKEPTKPEPADHGERKHASKSPSKLKNLDICGGYTSDENRDPHPRTVFGTEVHQFMEDWCRGQKPNYPTPEHKEHAELCIGYTGSVLNPSNMPQSETNTPAELGNWLIDVEPRLETNEENTFGYCDLLASKGPVGHLFDWKCGRWYQGDAEDNLQGKAYCLGAFRKYDRLTEITVHFVYSDLQEVTSHTFKRSDCGSIESAISQINRNSEKIDAGDTSLLKIDQENCRFCALLGKCAATLPVVEQSAAVVASENGLPIPKSFDILHVSDGEEMANILNVAFLLEAKIKEAKGHALMLAQERGIDVPGYKLVDVKGRISDCKDVAGAFAVAQQYGVTTNELLSCCKLKPAQLSKMARNHVDKGMQKAEDNLRAALFAAGMATLGNGYSYLKRESKQDYTTDLPEGSFS